MLQPPISAIGLGTSGASSGGGRLAMFKAPVGQGKPPAQAAAFTAMNNGPQFSSDTSQSPFAAAGSAGAGGLNLIS